MGDLGGGGGVVTGDSTGGGGEVVLSSILNSTFGFSMDSVLPVVMGDLGGGGCVSCFFSTATSFGRVGGAFTTAGGFEVFIV